jgi:hypothetical protein
MQLVDPVERVKDYATGKQNLCLIGNRLADRTGKPEFAKQASADCQEALQYMSANDEPQLWGTAQNNLAISYAIYAGLSKDPQALKQAISEFTNAQAVFTQKRFPVNWAEVEVNLAELNCRLSLLTGEARYLDTSDEHSKAALKVFIANNVAKYSDYITRLMAKVKQCDRQNIAVCECSP